LRTVDELDVVAMLTMFDEDGERSRSHGLRPDVIEAQADRLGLEQLSARCNWDTYTDRYVALLDELSSRAITHVVFGDIMGEAHRAWNRQVCARHGLTPVMPIWGESTSVVAREFVARGGEALLVTVRPPALDQMWLGAAMTDDAIARLEALGVDPCGEFGEYHTVVTSCPRFSSRLDLVPGERVMRGGCWALDFTVA
jgi:uncharacterized protein (TIGR00290 family)